VLAGRDDCAILVVGDGELRLPLMARAKELRVAERVLFPGFRDDVPAILRAIDLFVMPSHLEGLGTIVLDALCCGVPVVAARAGGIPEAIRDGENGILVPPKEPAALAAAILRVLADDTLARRLAAAGPPTVAARFTADRMTEGNIAVYERLIGR